MPTDRNSSIAGDAVRAVSLAGRIVNYAWLAAFVAGILLIGIGSFVTAKGSGFHRFAVAFGYTAFFGVGFGLLFLSQYLLRQILWLFFSAGVSALAQPPSQPNPDAAPAGAARKDETP
jgi:hypothetical protein